MKINFKSLSLNLSFQESAISDMYYRNKITGSELEELQKCLNALYRFNKNMMRLFDSECFVSDDHIETKF